MQCPKCGADVTGGAESCPACGEPTPEPSSVLPGGSASARGFAVSRQPVVYAGFWLRAIAYGLDVLLLAIVAGFAILKPMMNRAGIPMDNPWRFWTDTSRQIIAIKIAILMSGWLYWALMESSSWQATIGKKMLGLRVSDLAGRRISLARASGRYFAKLLSQFFLFIGFLMAGFTQKKQALHDLLAGCLVIRNR